MFKKLVVIEPINMLQIHKDKLFEIAENVIFYNDIPQTDEEKIRRIDDAEAVLLSYTSSLNKKCLESCKNIKYVGMCCSLYSPEAANVDIKAAEELGITVRGIRDYGDEGVAEYVIHELVEFLQGYNGFKWSDIAYEITGLKCGVVGLGTSGSLIARALKFFKADVSYYSRTRKLDMEKEGFKYLDLNTLCSECNAIFLALNKNVFLLQEEQFELMSGKKILFNTSIGPGFDVKAFEKWMQDPNHFFFGDTLATSGLEDIWNLPNAKTINRSAGGKSYQAYVRLGEKVLNNIYEFINNKK